MKHLGFSIIFYLFISSVFAQALILPEIQSLDLGDDSSQIAQKFKMANYLLNHSPVIKRIESSEINDAIILMKAAQLNYKLAVSKARQKNWLEANAIIDSVLRDMTTSSQLLNKKVISENLYHENLKRVEAFIMPEWSDLSAGDRELLSNTSDQIESLLDQVEKQAKAKEYDNANSNLYKIYGLKTQLLKELDHKTTIIYDLMFETPGEEYDYLLKRNQHYQLMVDKVMMENTFSQETMDQINIYLEQSKAAMIEARLMEADNQNEQAIKILNQSITDLSNALIVMGIRI